MFQRSWFNNGLHISNVEIYIKTLALLTFSFRKKHFPVSSLTMMSTFTFYFKSTFKTKLLFTFSVHFWWYTFTSNCVKKFPKVLLLLKYSNLIQRCLQLLRVWYTTTIATEIDVHYLVQFLTPYVLTVFLAWLPFIAGCCWPRCAPLHIYQLSASSTEPALGIKTHYSSLYKYILYIYILHKARLSYATLHCSYTHTPTTADQMLHCQPELVFYSHYLHICIVSEMVTQFE